jgi:hypothetical protein
LRQQWLIEQDDDVTIQELVFDYDPSQLAEVQRVVAEGVLRPPIPPRQYFPVIAPPAGFAELPKTIGPASKADWYRGAAWKDPDEPFTFGLCSGLCVDEGRRFIRAFAFCRRRRNHEVRGPGRMFCLIFRDKRAPRPFAIGDQCHFGLGLFLPSNDKDAADARLAADR